MGYARSTSSDSFLTTNNMRKETFTKLLLLGLLAGGAASGVSAIQTFADDTTDSVDSEDNPYGMHQEWEPHFMDEVNRSMENIDNGIVLTITSDDPDTVKKLQETGGFPMGMRGHSGRHHWEE